MEEIHGGMQGRDPPWGSGWGLGCHRVVKKW